jgi:hypothetical protein
MEKVSISALELVEVKGENILLFIFETRLLLVGDKVEELFFIYSCVCSVCLIELLFGII